MALWLLFSFIKLDLATPEILSKIRHQDQVSTPDFAASSLVPNDNGNTTFARV